MFELRVLTGLHQGAALPLIGDQWLIGANDTLDLALHDPGVSPFHCRLEREGDAWALNAEEGKVVDSEGHAHALTALQPNNPFVLGGVWLAVCEAEQPWPTLPAPVPEASPSEAEQAASETAGQAPVKARSSLFNRVTLMVVGALIGVVGSAWSLSYSTPPGAHSMPRSVADETVQSAARPAKATDTRERLSADQTVLKLKGMLSDRLLNEVTLEETAQGLVLRGNLQDESRLVYNRMLERFNDRYHSAVTLVDEVSVGGSSLPFAIVQIMSGPQAHLVTAEGKRMYIGDELQGLRLTKIDDGRIEFEGDRHYEVNW